jgi:hypothetical protein
MNTKPVVPIHQGAALAEAAPPIREDLKSERVQEPVATVRTQLKSERVQDGLAAAGGAEAKPAFVLELAIYQPQTVTLELFESKVAITLHGIAAVANSGIAG